jgi:predicted transglutaminase-like cysteine proteinase
MRYLLTAIALLTAGAAAAQTPPAAEPAKPAVMDKSQEIVCRRDAEVGSLIKRKRTCHTRAQWAAIQDRNQEVGRSMVEGSRALPSGQ